MPNWKMTVKIKDLLDEDDSDDNAQYVGREIAKRLRASAWDMPEYVLDAFAGGVVNAHDLNRLLVAMYDRADYDRVWID